MMFGIESVSAFLAGLLSFFSPCVLPLIPGYISLVSGVSAGELAAGKAGARAALKAGLHTLVFCTGFSAVFVLLGSSASALSAALVSHRAEIYYAAGAMAILFGLQLCGVINIKPLNYEKRLAMPASAAGLGGAFLMGVAFGAGWTPCLGPVLAALLAVAATQETAARGAWLLTFYCAGLSAPFIAAGFAAGRLLAPLAKYRNAVRYSETASGILMVIVGAALIFAAKVPVLQKLIPF